MDGPHIRALVFMFIGVAAAFGVLWDLKSGVATDDGIWKFSAAGNPVGFLGVVVMKLGIVALGVAELMFTFNVIGDPWVPLMSFAHGFGLGDGG